MFTMKKIVLLSFAVLLATASYGQSAFGDKVASTKAKITSNFQSSQSNIQDQQRAAEASLAKTMANYDAYCKKMMKLWGDASEVQSTMKSWVDYSKTSDSRSIVDFETGDVTVEVLADPGESEEQINEKLELAVGSLLENKGTPPVYDVEVSTVKPASEKPILDGQVDLKKYAVAGNETVAEAIVKEEPKEVKKVETENGPKQVVTVRMKLVEDHIPKRAEGFKEFISKHASTHGIDQPLVYAVIEQESAFNPMARSSAGAYGLMQIIPSSGGRDANGYVNNRDVSPTPSELYDPNFNIQLGVGYLKKQMRVYFKGIRDKQAAMLCAIAAYNTGQGNVYYALTGKKSSSGVADKVNSMSYDELYDYLKVKLPHAETRDYIQKVTSKMQKYTE